MIFNADQALDFSKNIVAAEMSETVGEVTLDEALRKFLPENDIVSMRKVQLNTTGESVGSTITIQSDTLDLLIPDGTTIYAPEDWNGILAPPKEVTGAVVRSGFVTNEAVDVGPNTITSLLLDKPARVIIPTSTGIPYYSANGSSWILISSQCAGGDMFTSPAALGFPDECYLKFGGKTVIWTYHFTIFANMLELGDDGKIVNYYNSPVRVEHPFDVVKPVTIKQKKKEDKIKNKQLMPGEKTTLALYLKNNLDIDVKKLDVTITCKNPYVNIKKDKKPYTGKINKFAKGSEKEVKEPFKFELKPNTPIGEKITFNVESQDPKSGLISQDSFTLEVKAPN